MLPKNLEDSGNGWIGYIASKATRDYNMNGTTMLVMLSKCMLAPKNFI